GEVGMVAINRVDRISLDELHCQMGHISPKAAMRLVDEGIIEGIELMSRQEKSCDSCAYAKSTRKPIKKERSKPRAQSIGDEIHSDLWGPAPIQTPSHKKYYASFTDDHSRYTHVWLMTAKDETFETYKAYEALLETQFSARIKKLHTDRGGEYLSGEF